MTFPAIVNDLLIEAAAEAGLDLSADDWEALYERARARRADARVQSLLAALRRPPSFEAIWFLAGRGVGDVDTLVVTVADDDERALRQCQAVAQVFWGDPDPFISVVPCSQFWQQENAIRLYPTREEAADAG